VRVVRAITTAIASAAVVTLLSGCILDAERREVEELTDEQANAQFYTLPSDLSPGEPGEIIRSKPIDSAPAGTRAWRVIYHSRDRAGTDIPVSATVIVPDLPAPEGGRIVVAWAHPTTGAAQQCAPSLASNPFLYVEGMDALLADGYAVVSTDYPGMGVAGESSYLLGVTESNSVLDSVRAARNLTEISLSDRVLLWGHSQGGQAALFAAQRAGDYAPELTIEAVAVAAPAADLTELLSDDITDLAGVTITSYAVVAYEAAYAERYPEGTLQAILTPEGTVGTPKMAALCLLTQNKEIHAIADPLVGNYVTSDPATTEPWRSLLTENSAGGAPISVPIFVGQGLADTLVIPAATEGYVGRLCAAGEHVRFEKYPGVTHALAAFASLPELVPWFAEVVAGNPGRSDC